MSLAGSIASTMLRSRIVGGSGIWTMMPSTAGSALRERIVSTTLDSEASPSTSTSRPSIPTLAQLRRIWPRYTIEGASRPTITIASVGGRSFRSWKPATSSLTAWRISVAIGPPWSSRAPPRGTRVTPSCRRRLHGLTGFAAPDPLVDVFCQLVDPLEHLRHLGSRLGRVGGVVDRRQVDQDVGRGAAGGRLREEGRD